MSPAPPSVPLSILHHHHHHGAPPPHSGVAERHAHFEEGQEATNAASGKKSKTPTSQTVFLDEDSNSESAAAGGGSDKNKKDGTSRTEGADDDGDDDTDSDDDEDARLRSHAFQRHHAKKAATSSTHAKGKGKGGLKVKRFDEYSDFLSRSERSRRDKQQRTAAGQNEEEGKTGGKVNWHPEGEASSIQVLPEISPDDASSLYLTRDVWERIDLDLELTRKRWDNHVSGRIAFDFLNNTIRGMEAMIDDEGSRRRDSVVRRRVKSVLDEQNRQRIAKEFYDAPKMRAVAIQTSLQDEASQRGLADAEEAVNIWLGKSSEAHRPAGGGGGAAAATTTSSKSKSSRSAGDKKKKKGSGGGFNLFGMFHGKHKK